MPYYMGDYYAGDMGDPGFLRFLGRAASGFGLTKRFFGSRVGSALARVIPGGPIVSRAAGALSRAASMGKMVVRAHPAGTAVAGIVASSGAIAAISHRAAPAAAGMAMMPRMAPAGLEAPMRGFHLSRRTGAMVRNRRMRVTNPKALHRAIRRAMGFARLARRVLHFVSARAPKGRAIFRTKRRTTTRMKV